MLSFYLYMTFTSEVKQMWHMYRYDKYPYFSFIKNMWYQNKVDYCLKHFKLVTNIFADDIFGLNYVFISASHVIAIIDDITAKKTIPI